MLFQIQYSTNLHLLNTECVIIRYLRVRGFSYPAEPQADTDTYVGRAGALALVCGTLHGTFSVLEYLLDLWNFEVAPCPGHTAHAHFM